MILNNYQFTLLLNSVRKIENIQFLEYFVRNSLGNRTLIYKPEMLREEFMTLIKSNLYDTIVINKTDLPELIPKSEKDDEIIASKSQKINTVVRMLRNLDKKIVIIGLADQKSFNAPPLHIVNHGRALMYQSDLVIIFNENMSPEIFKNRYYDANVIEYFKKQVTLFKRIRKLKYIFNKK